MSEVKISIIIPFYNAEKFMKGCLECLKNQTLKDIEIIFVNDGSTDNGADILTEASKNIENIVIINKKNSGQGDSRNVGLKNARGEYIYFLDADDFIAINALEIAYLDAIKYNADMVVFDSINVKECLENQIDFEHISQEHMLGGHYTKRSIPAGQVISGRQLIIDSLNSPESFFVVIWLALYKKSLLLDNSILFVKTSYEDNIFSMDTALAAKSIVYRPEILHFRRLVPSSFIHEKKVEKHVVGAMRVMEHAAEICDREAVVRESKRSLQRWALICAGNSLSNILLSDESVRKKYKWKYINFLLRDLKIYNIKLLIVAIVKL
jgi:glycosyltransferase involved in cell wall biosynthesis